MQANRITASRRSPWRIALDTRARAFGARAVGTQHARLASSAMPAAMHATPSRQRQPQPSRRCQPLEATLGAVDFLAQLDDALRFSLRVGCEHRASSAITATISSMLTLHDLVRVADEADELNALVARAQASGKLESATLVARQVADLSDLRRAAARVDRRARHRPASRSPRSTCRTGATTRRAHARAATTTALTGLANLVGADRRRVNAVQAEAEHTRTQAGARAARHRRLSAHQPRARLRRRRRHAARDRAAHPAHGRARRDRGARGERRVRRARCPPAHRRRNAAEKPRPAPA